MLLAGLLRVRRRAYLLAVLIGVFCVWVWASTQRLQRLQELVFDEPADEQTLMVGVEQSVLNKLQYHHRPGYQGPGGREDVVAAAAIGLGRQQVEITLGAGSFRRAQSLDPLPEPAFLQPRNKLLAEETMSVIRASRQCRMHRNTDCWGEVLVPGDTHKLPSPEDCCQACSEYQPTPENGMLDCNVWVYCEDPQWCGGQHKECWLKHKPQPSGANIAPHGPEVGWTTGIMTEPDDYLQLPPASSEERRYHIAMTAAGAANQWQSRIAYFWYRKVKAQCETEGNCQMGGFTRLLHSGVPDELMSEIPTFVTQPIPPDHPAAGFAVLNRPYAFVQWLQTVTVPEKYIFMMEPDQIWIKPMPNPMRGDRPAAFPYFYIEPWKPESLPIVTKYLGPLTRQQAESLLPIGNSPTFMSFDDLRRVVPIWFNYSIDVHFDPAANKAWGWVQEMHAFSLACTKAGIKKVDLLPKMMGAPPYDFELNLNYLLHYTYSNDFSLGGAFVQGERGEWHFDKRDFYALPPPRGLPIPPFPLRNMLVHHLMYAINFATNSIPGWDEYAQTGRVTQLWNGMV